MRSGPVPVMMQFGLRRFRTGAWSGPPARRRAAAGARRRRPAAGRGPGGPTWQQQVLAKGWGYADPQSPAAFRPTTARA